MRVLVAATALLLLAGPAAAQTTDAKLWISGGADVDVGRRVELRAEQELRVGADSAFDRTHTEVAARLRVKRWLRLGALYRLIIMDSETRHRVTGESELIATPGRFRLALRSRLQVTTRPGNDTQVLVRNRGKLELRAGKRARPFAAIELHHQLSPTGEFREVRVYLGLEWQLTERLDVEGFYLYQEESNVGNPETNHVVGFGAVYHFEDVR